MRYSEIITEGLPQGGTLYHGTDIMAAARILYKDEISARTDHGSENGVSLTRSIRFAMDWKGGAGAVFALNGDMLRSRSQIRPMDYYRDRREAEEFLLADIKPLSKYLVTIYISPETREWCIEHDDELIEGHKDFEDLLKHPLLKIRKMPSKPAPYYNPRNPKAGIFDTTP